VPAFCVCSDTPPSSTATCTSSRPGRARTLKAVPCTLTDASLAFTMKGCSGSLRTSKYASPLRCTTRRFRSLNNRGKRSVLLALSFTFVPSESRSVARSPRSVTASRYIDSCTDSPKNPALQSITPPRTRSRTVAATIPPLGNDDRGNARLGPSLTSLSDRAGSARARTACSSGAESADEGDGGEDAPISSRSSSHSASTSSQSSELSVGGAPAASQIRRSCFTSAFRDGSSPIHSSTSRFSSGEHSPDMYFASLGQGI